MPLPKPIIFLLAILGGVVVPLALFVLIRLAVDKAFRYLEACGLWVPRRIRALWSAPTARAGGGAHPSARRMCWWKASSWRTPRVWRHSGWPSRSRRL